MLPLFYSGNISISASDLFCKAVRGLWRHLAIKSEIRTFARSHASWTLVYALIAADPGLWKRAMHTICTRGGGWSQKLRRHGGYKSLGLVWRVGHSNGGAGPRRAGCVRGSPLPQRGTGGVIPGNFEIANAKYCILMHFSALSPWCTPMDGIHALFDFWGLGENYLEKLEPAADWTGAEEAEHFYVCSIIVCIHCILQLHWFSYCH